MCILQRNQCFPNNVHDHNADSHFHSCSAKNIGPVMFHKDLLNSIEKSCRKNVDGRNRVSIICPNTSFGVRNNGGKLEMQVEDVH